MTVAETIRTVFRHESGKLVAAIARIVRDLGLAEELAQDVLVIALERWPETGVPDNPGAWLMTAGRNRALNAVQRHRMLERRHDVLGHEPTPSPPDLVDHIDNDIGDDMLRLIFTACHSVLSTEARVALTLRLIGGLSTEEIARAFLVQETTIAQRIVRAKRTLAEAGVAFELPRGDELPEALASVLEVIYLIFNEGYSASSGEDPIRPALCEDALRLGRVLAGVAPSEPEVYGLVALIELHASRMPARVAPTGDAVSLLEQDRARWDHVQIRRGLDALAKAEALGGARGRYALQAAISACHARATTAAATDWARIAELYRELAIVTPSPVVELNRAMAVAMAHGPAAGLEILDAISDESALRDYHWLPSARGDLLAKLGRLDEARSELERAAQLTPNARERELLLEKSRGLG